MSKAFTRKTSLTLERVFWLIVSRIVQSLPVALHSFFDALDLPAVTKGAFSMKRALVKSTLFEDIGRGIVEDLYSRSQRIKKWRGYVVLACDGSRIALPDVDEVGVLYGYFHSASGERLYPGAKASIFQDVLNNITVCASLDKKDMDERYAFADSFEEANRRAGGKTIMTLDRGYFSYLLMYLMISSGQPFVMKARKAPWRTSFLKSGKQEDIVKITPSHATSVYSNAQWKKEKDKTLRIRRVRFEHPDGSVDVLITNLYDTRAVTSDDIISLYRMRWGAETAYGVYKNDEALELFSSFRPDGLLQDFHAAIIMYNLASIMAMACEVAKKGRKPDMNVAIGLVHNLCPMLTLPYNHVRHRIKMTERCLSENIISIHTGRSYPRRKRTRKRNGKFYRHLNYAMAV